MKKTIRQIGAALSLYSKIPMPYYEWTDKDIACAIMYLPLVGVVIAALEYYANHILSALNIAVSVRSVIFILIPLLVTGGFHVDGYMDTADAIRSYQPKEKKLQIIDDPHIGAFSVISLVCSFLIMYSSVYIILDRGGCEATLGCCVLFVISRALAGLTSVCQKVAKDDDMLAGEMQNNNTVIYVMLYLWLFASLVFVLLTDIPNSLVMAASGVAFTIYYLRMTGKHFGGVLGDTAGYFVTAGEVFMILCMAVLTLIRGAI